MAASTLHRLAFSLAPDFENRRSLSGRSISQSKTGKQCENTETTYENNDNFPEIYNYASIYTAEYLEYSAGWLVTWLCYFILVGDLM